MRQADCGRNCWIVGAIFGLLVVLFASGFGQTSFLGGVFLGLVTLVLVSLLLSWLVCAGEGTDYDVEAGLEARPLADEAASGTLIAVAPAVTEAADAPVAAEAAPVHAEGQAEVAQVVEAAPAPAAAAKPEQAAAEAFAAKLDTAKAEAAKAEVVKAEAVKADKEKSKSKEKPAKDKATKEKAEKPGKDKVGKKAPEAKAAAKGKKATADDLKLINGIGPKVEAALHELGVTRFAEIAAWDGETVARFTRDLGRRGARIESDDWVGQARALAGGADG